MSINQKSFELDPDDDRFSNIETMITYQEQQLDILTKNYNEQQKQLFNMEKDLKRLKDIIISLQANSVKSSSEETPPPHY